MADEETPKVNEGEELLAKAWWEAVQELRAILNLNEDAKHRLEAASILMDYFKSMNMGINAPFIPEDMPDFASEYEDDEDDDE